MHDTVKERMAVRSARVRPAPGEPIGGIADRLARFVTALRALRALVREPDETNHVFDVMCALDPLLLERLSARWHPATDAGALVAALDDRAWLARLPPDSLGGAYFDFTEARNIRPRGLVELWHARGQYPDDARLAAFLERHIYVHDLLHVVTGFDSDPRGEACLLWFCWAQERSPGTLLLAAGAVLANPSWARAAWRAWRRGRRLHWVFALPLESLLRAPLGDVRRLAEAGGTLSDRPGYRREPLL